MTLILVNHFTVNIKINLKSFIQHQEKKIFLDLKSPQINNLKFQNYDIFILCSSITSIQYCERKPILSKINVDGLKYVIKKILHTKKLILLSSSAVFNGKKEFYIEDDYRKPINNYGKHKKEIEEYIKKFKNYAILRLTKVDITLIPLISEWIKNLNSNFSIKPFSNKYLSLYLYHQF